MQPHPHAPTQPTPCLLYTSIARLNPDSLKVIHGFAEPYLAQAKVGDDFQFLRMGYFCKDKDSTADMAVSVSYTHLEALAFLARIRQKHKDATHNCYAYIIGLNSGIMRYLSLIHI